MWGSSHVQLMGVVNVTPDSFSGDGIPDAGAAVAHGLALAAAGADIVDVGGESTRPGHVPVPAEEEIARALPVVRALAGRGLTVSIDTYKLEVAAAAADAGARIVNDIWGLQRSAGIARLAAGLGLGLVLMHNQEGTAYAGDLMAGVAAGLRRSVEVAIAAGVAPDLIAIDPGIGFGKTAAQNVEVLRRLPELAALGHPVLVGVSRKSFLGRIFRQDGEARRWGTAAAVAISVLNGASVVRVHDVAEMRAVVEVAQALRPTPA